MYLLDYMLLQFICAVAYLNVVGSTKNVFYISQVSFQFVSQVSLQLCKGLPLQFCCDLQIYSELNLSQRKS